MGGWGSGDKREGYARGESFGEWPSAPTNVMAGLVPAIHESLGTAWSTSDSLIARRRVEEQDVDGRDSPAMTERWVI